MNRCPDRAGKITGMLLELDASQLEKMLNTPEALVAGVKNSLEVLNEHEVSSYFPKCLLRKQRRGKHV